MRFVSTRGGAPDVSIEAALAAGLAPDGGLYVPECLPVWAPSTLESLAGSGLAAVATHVLAPFFTGSTLQDRMRDLCARAFDFPAPLRPLRREGDWMLELFHGPTAAFKDFAARLLAGVLAALRNNAAETTVLVATSGDTGAAVAAAFHRRPGFKVVILYPDRRVSPRQAHSLECWGDNVRCFRVAGTFDDCQRLARQALADAGLRRDIRLASANSISLGRLLPQAAYYAHAAGHFAAAHGQALNVIVPTGNLGNACAAVLAKAMGVPIGEILLATNANDVLPRYFDGCRYLPQPARATLANAMDVGAPSNFERLRHWHAGDQALRRSLRAISVDDATIRSTIRNAIRRYGVIPCPHTATALHALDRLRSEGDRRAWAVVATAHPAKFDTVVEPLAGQAIALPPALSRMLARPARAQTLEPDYPTLRRRFLD